MQVSCRDFLVWEPASRELGQHPFEILPGELPLKGPRVLLVAGLKLKQRGFDRAQVREFVRGQDFPLDYGEVDFDLVQPTGVNRRVNLDSIGIPLAKALHRGLAAMGGAVVGHPEDPAG